jgi:hypothetical protein
VGVLNVFRRIDRAIGRFNDWFAPAAVAAHSEPNLPNQRVDPTSVVAALGELEKQTKPDDEGRPG